MTTLQDLLRQAMTDRKVTSGRALAELAAKHGQKIDRTQVNGIVGGTYKSKPSRPLLEAVAWLAQRDLEDVYEAANLPLPGPSFADELPPDADYLSPQQRHAVITVIRALLSSAEDGRGEGHAGPPAMNAPDISPAAPNEHLLAQAARTAGLTEAEQAEEQVRRAMAKGREDAHEAKEVDEQGRSA